MKNTDSIKDNLVTSLKETLKFALVALAIMWTLGALMIYLFIFVLNFNPDISALIAALITAILIFIVDEKKLHSYDKVHECNRKIIDKAFQLNEVD